MAFLRPMTSVLYNLPVSVLLCLVLFSFVSMGSTLSRASENQGVFPQADRVFVRNLLAELPEKVSQPDRIVRISNYFLGKPYKANTLIGSLTKQEHLFADLSGFDCFTFLDVVDALRRSRHAEDFLPRLTNVRYKDNSVAYLKRRHFFSDWLNREAQDIIDVTASIDPANTKKVSKKLNQRTDGSSWVEGLPVVMRTISYLPPSLISKDALKKLEGGDYVGFYSSKDGLDVEHTGILVKAGNKLVLRHASSVKKAVVDEPLIDYLQGQEGLIVYRVISNE